MAKCDTKRLSQRRTTKGWLSPTERACVSICNQPKAHFGFPWVRPWDNRGKCHIKRGFNACQTHRSMYPSIFNHFPVIQPVNSKVRNFSTFLHILASPGYVPGTIAVNVIWMERGLNAGQSIAAYIHLSSTVYEL